MPKDLNQSENEQNKTSPESRIGTENSFESELFIKEQAEKTDAESDLVESGNDIINAKISEIEDSPETEDFRKETEALNAEAKNAKSVLENKLSETAGELYEKKIDENDKIRENHMEMINKSEITVKTGEHLAAEGANLSRFIVESGAILTLESANKSKIFVKKGGKLNIESQNQCVIKYEENGDTLDSLDAENIQNKNESLKNEIAEKGAAGSDPENIKAYEVKDGIQNEAGFVAEISEMKRSLEALYFSALNDSGKKKALKEIGDQYLNLRNRIDEKDRENLFKKYPEFGLVVELIKKIDDDISNKKDDNKKTVDDPVNEPPAPVSEPNKEEFATNDHETKMPENPDENETNKENINETKTEVETESGEKIEINAAFIREKINKNEPFSEDETKTLAETINKIEGKSGELSDEENELLTLYVKATVEGLTPKGMEMKKAIDDLPEVKEFKEKSKEGKDQEINERIDKIKNSGIELSSETAGIQRNMEELKKQLEEKYKAFVELEEGLEKVRGSEELNQEGIETLTATVSSLKSIYSDHLNLEYYEYWMKYLEGGTEALYETHAQRNLSMENWEKLIGSLGDQLERMEKGEEEVLREWARWAKDHPKAALAILAALVAAGVAMAPYLAKMIGAKEAAEAAGGIGKIAIPAIKPIGALGAKVLGGMIATGKTGFLAGIFLWLTNSEKIDDAMESLWGKKIPSWASWGLKKKRDRK